MRSPLFLATVATLFAVQAQASVPGFAGLLREEKDAHPLSNLDAHGAVANDAAIRDLSAAGLEDSADFLMTQGQFATLVSTTEGFSLSSWLQEQTNEIRAAIHRLASRAEGLINSAISSVAEWGGDLQDRLLDLAREVIDTLDVTKEELRAQKAVVEQAKSRLRRLLSADELRLETEGESLRRDAREGKAQGTTQMLLEMSRGMPDGQLEEAIQHHANSGAGDHWHWAARQLSEAARRDGANHPNDRDSLLQTGAGAGAGAGVGASPCDCLYGNKPKVGVYDPDAWGDQCRDWDRAGFKWCYVSNPRACRDYPITMSKRYTRYGWRKCGFGVWANRQVQQGIARGTELVEDVVETTTAVRETVVETVTELHDDAREHISNIRDRVLGRLDEINDRVTEAFEEWQRNGAKRDALRALARELVKYDAMSFAHNAKIVIGQAIEFITNTAAQAARDAIPDLIVAGLHGSVNVGIGGMEIVYDMATLQRMVFSYQGIEVGTKVAEVGSIGGSIGIGWKGNTEGSALSEAYSGGFVSLSASAGPSLGIVSLGVGGLFAVSSTNNFVPVPAAVKTLSLTGSASIGAEIPVLDVSGGVGFTMYTAKKPGDCYANPAAFIKALLLDLRLPDLITRLMGAVGALARSTHHQSAARNARNECKR